MTKQEYKELHDKLLAKMRGQLRERKLAALQLTGKRIHRLRKRYRRYFAS